MDSCKVKVFLLSGFLNIFSSHPETPDVNLAVSEFESGDLRSGKEVEELRGGVRRYAAQARPTIDVARAEKHPFGRKLF